MTLREATEVAIAAGRVVSRIGWRTELAPELVDGVPIYHVTGTVDVAPMSRGLLDTIYGESDDGWEVRGEPRACA